MAFERIGASGESIRVRNNDWFIYRSNNGKRDVKVLRINSNDELEFLYIPKVGSDRLVSKSEIDVLENRIIALEAALAGLMGSRFAIHSEVITQEMLDLKQIVLPDAPNLGKIVMLVQDSLPQFGNTDFSISENVISWDGYDLNNILQLNDAIRLIYLY